MLYVYGKTMGLLSRAGQGVRWAGNEIAGLDTQYADAVAQLIRAKAPQGTKSLLEISSGAPIGSGYDTIKADSRWEHALGIGALAGLDVTNFAARYAMPAGGVTLAGKGIADLTAMIVNADGQQPSELSL